MIAVLDPKIADHAARRVLHLLDVAVDHELARRDHRARDFGPRAPAQGDAGKHEHGGEAEQQIAPQRVLDGQDAYSC